MTKVYVGNLAHDVDHRDLEDIFGKFGELDAGRGGHGGIFVARSPPGFAFVDYVDEKDAQEAIRECDGREIKGQRIRCEISKSRGRDGGRGGGGGGGGGFRGGGGRGGGFKVRLSGLPASASWQGLKDLFRENGSLECTYTNVDHDARTG